jgi:hypothetical protein
MAGEPAYSRALYRHKERAMNETQIYEQFAKQVAEIRERERKKGPIKTLRQIFEEQGVKPIDVEELKAIITRLNSDEDADDSLEDREERSHDAL